MLSLIPEIWFVTGPIMFMVWMLGAGLMGQLK
jgi:hypothetical protein